MWGPVSRKTKLRRELRLEHRCGPTNLRLNPQTWLVGLPLVLCACFGRVSDEDTPPTAPPPRNDQFTPHEEPTEQTPPQSEAGGAVNAASTGGRHHRREESRPPRPIASGGAGSGGGSTGGETPPAPAEFPPFPPPPCGPECCPGALTEVALTRDGSALEADIQKPHLSGDGSWVLFAASASSLDGVDDQGVTGVFVHSLASGQTVRLTRTAAEFANGPSAGDAISDSGRFVLFTSQASNLVAADDNGTSDVFVHDQLTRETRLVSRSMDGGSANGRSVGRDLSSDGRFAVFSSIANDLTEDDTNDAWDVFVADLSEGLLERISMGPGDQQSNVFSGNHAHITPDGRYVSFHSKSDSLVPGDQNGAFDIFLFDRLSKSTSLISARGTNGPPDGNTFVLGMSDDARFFSGYSQATNLVPDDHNERPDVFVHDRIAGGARRINVGPDGEEANAESLSGALSADGRYVAYASAASNLARPDAAATTEAFVFDLQTGRNTRLSQDGAGVPGDGDSDSPTLSRGGECVVFTSRASNLPGPGSGTGLARLLIRRTP